jgi:hypothetical protein
MEDQSFYVHRFLVVFPLWFSLPERFPARATAKKSCAVATVRPSGIIRYTPIFTDRDLAEQFAVQMERPSGDWFDSKFLKIPDRAYLEELLTVLWAVGYTDLSFDPEPHRDIIIPIAVVQTALRTQIH